MNKAAIYHRPESEMAYLYKPNEVHIRLRVAKDDIVSVQLAFSDPYKHGFYEMAKMRKLTTTESADFYQAEVTVPTKRMDYLFVVESVNGERAILTNRELVPYDETLLTKKYAAFRLPYFHEVDAFHAPEWVKKMVWYQIFPERFANGDKSNDPEGVKVWDSADTPSRKDFYGGDLQGVIDHLDHLVELGVNGIYFTPIFKSPTNHKYDTEDYLQIDPHFGDLTLFKKLVTAAHARGMKVMLDAVFNHVGDQSREWQDVLKNQEQSRYADWFHVNSWPITGDESTGDFEYSDNLSYDTFSFTPHMPKWNTANPEVERYLLHIADYWIRECDIDAWRLDVANEVDHTFWKKFRQTCDRAKKDFYILGEIWHSAQPWLEGDEFTGVMNYPYTAAIIDYFVKQKIKLEDMVAQMNTQLMLYRKQTTQALLNVLDSHDTPRFLTMAKGDKELMRQVEAFAYMQPGSPCIYYGDEYALSGGKDPDCRKPMPWTPEKQDTQMFTFFKELVAFRKKYAEELSETDLVWTVVDSEKGVIGLRRGNLRAVFNTGKEAVEAEAEQILLSQNYVNGHLQNRGFVIYK